jgi:hypothetical protein
MFPAEMLKRLLQQNRPDADIARPFQAHLQRL